MGLLLITSTECSFFSLDFYLVITSFLLSNGSLSVVKKKIKEKEKKEHIRKLKKKRNALTAVSDQPTVPAISMSSDERVAPVKVDENSANIKRYLQLVRTYGGKWQSLAEMVEK